MSEPIPARRSDWPELLRSATTEQVALEVLEHLQWQTTGRLLNFDLGTRRRLRAYFERQAKAQLAKLELDGEALERAPEGRWLIAEEALEGTGQYAAAAAYYGVAHDSLRAGDDVDDRTLFDRLMLRFKLAFAMGVHDESDSAWNRRLADFTCQTAELLESARSRLTKPAYDFLYFRLHYWLGLQWKSLAEYRSAGEALGKAAVYADEPEDRISTSLHLAEAKVKLGDPQRAYDLLMLCRDDLPEADEDTRQLWQVQTAALKMALGGTVEPGVVSSLPPANRALPEVFQRSLDDESPLDRRALRAVEDLSRELLEQGGEEDLDLRHAALLQRSLVLQSRGETDAEKAADELLDQAEALEARLHDERFPLRRKLARARVLAARGRAKEAVALFAAVMPRVHRVLSLVESAQATGEYLIALGKAPPDLAEVVKQVRSAYVDLEVLLAEQPLGSARRRAREIHQRVIEAGLVAMITAIEGRDREDEDVQEALGWAWRLLMNNRNVEIHWKSPDPTREHGHSEEAEDVEGAFHARLRNALYAGELGDCAWSAALSALEDYELSAHRDKRLSRVHDLRPDGTSVSLAFFKFRDLFGARHPTLVLLCFADRFDWTILADDPGGVEQDLDQWTRTFFEGESDSSPRSVTHESPGSSFGEEHLRQGPAITRLMPASLVLLPVRRLPGLRETNESPVPSCGRPMFDRPWYLFPDGLLSTSPVEMLPERAGGEVCFGQNRAVTLCLRPAVPEGVRRPIDFSRGWLGLGEAPAAGEIPELPGSGQEVRSIQRQLEEHGYRRSRVLVGEEARADRLTEELAELQPAVLHLAVHGFADASHPEACALILADRPERPERELLPYRRIRRLPLENVDLVVLSACSSLIGRSGRAASMEGLAWAFLSRGATQVIASRYPVDDAATVTFMLQLYRQLRTLPVADALGRTRDICLEEGRLDPRQVAAWSVWC